MRRSIAVPLALLSALPALAQYPGQIKKDDKNAAPPMRSVVVVEWTGDLTKPKASRVIPISVWDGKDLQDGSVYLAQPEPLALQGGVEYQLQQDGKQVGLFDIQEAAHQQTSWIGFGKWAPIKTGPSPAEIARQRAAMKVDVDDADSDKPILHRKKHADDSGSGDTAQKGSAPDSDRPTLHRDGGSGSDSDDSSAKSSPDPDRPRLHNDSDSAGNGGDPDRPKLKSKPQADPDEGPVTSVASSGDPDRPTLKRGIPEGLSTAVTPNVVGLPAEMQQQVGVSDVHPVKDHPWDFSWADPDDQRKMKDSLEDEARKALGLTPPPPPTAPKRPATTAAARRKTVPPPAPAPVPLIDEQFRVFELAYGSGATIVFSAHTDGTNPGENGSQKFVTIIAQPDLYGSVITLLKNVTDAAHLDVKPRMRLVDPVDAEGDNRGELLFELRGQNQRQFALYRVLRGQADEIFTTGSSYFGAAGE